MEPLLLGEEYALNIRAKFVRGEEVKYISHLDMMKLFERALRRARIPIAHSQGFNPHPHIVFGLPLSVGVTSEAEYADFETTDSIDPIVFKDTLNRYSPLGVRIVEAAERNSKSNIMASITSATYEILVTTKLNVGIKDIQGKLQGLLESDQVYVSKESKGKIKNVDIRPMLYKAEIKLIQNSQALSDQEVSDNDVCKSTWILSYIDKLLDENENARDHFYGNLFCLSVFVSAGSAANLKPELVVNAFNGLTEFDLEIVKIHRSGLFVGEGDKMQNPLG